MSARPGRPNKKLQNHLPDARENIIRSACICFARQGIKGTTNKQIASQSGVTAAMVHYYFADKEALHDAVMQHAFTGLLEQMPGTQDLAEWVKLFHDNLLHKPWLPHLMVREVMSAGGLLRQSFLQNYAPQLYQQILRHIRRELHSEHQDGLDADRHAMLLLGMLIYPFLGMEIAGDIIGKTFNTDMLNACRDDALRLFRAGIAGSQPQG